MYQFDKKKLDFGCEGLLLTFFTRNLNSLLSKFLLTICDVLCTAQQKMGKNLLGHLLYRSVLLTQNGNNSTSLPSCRNLLINNEVSLGHWTRQSYGCHQNDANTLPSAESESRSPRIQRSVLLPKESSWTWKRFGQCQTIVTRM